MLRADIYVTSMLQQNAKTSGAVVWHRRIDCRPSSPVLEVDKVHTLSLQQTFHQLCIVKYRCLDQLLTSEVSHRNLKIVHKVTMVVLYLSIIYWGAISNRDFDLGFTSLNWYIHELLSCVSMIHKCQLSGTLLWSSYQGSTGNLSGNFLTLGTFLYDS